MIMRIALYTLLAMLWLAPPARAADEQGPRFESLAAGIALRPPGDLKAMRGAAGSGEVVRFFDEGRKWLIKVNRVVLEPEKPLPLTTWKDPKDGREHPGMLEFVVDQFKLETPGAQILRQDTTELAGLPAGMMAARFNIGLETNLIQQAIVRASDLQYFLISMTSPAPREGNVEDDPDVRHAVGTFMSMLSSVEVLDQSKLREDQEDRLFRTRSLYVNLTPDRLTRAIKNEQWLRVMRDGNDIGYTYVVEEVAHDIPRKGKPERQTGPAGILVGARSRMIAPSGTKIDSESWLFCSFDRKSETWCSIVFSDDATAGKNTVSEFGVTRWREKPVVAPTTEPAGIGGDIGKRPTVSLAEQYLLEVTKIGRNISPQPVTRDLPPFYLPQALGQLLPRLVQLNDPKGLAFVVWVSDAGQLMYRYVDVEKERVVTLNGQKVRAVPILDRVGLEGSVTAHYIAPSGEYLGSTNDDSGITILPTDAATLVKLWQNANLTRPGDVDQAK